MEITNASNVQIPVINVEVFMPVNKKGRYSNDLKFIEQRQDL